MSHWNFTPHKPLRSSYKQNPKAVKKGFKEEYPAIKKGGKFNMPVKYISITFLLIYFFVFVPIIFAQENIQSDEFGTATDESAIENILEIMGQETLLAKSTRMNIDFVPGMMAVLHGKDLEARGIKTVFEALSLIPGFQLTTNNFGINKVQVRGLGNTYATASLKLLLNDISINDALFGINSIIYDIPIEQVKRIEAIRGPGSVLYGENAVAGVINVITKKEAASVFSRIGTTGTIAAGGIYTFDKFENDIKMSINIAGWDTKGNNVTVTSDRLSNNPVLENTSFAPGPTNEAHESMTAITTIDYHEFSLVGQFSSIKMGDYYGFGFSLPSPEDKKIQTYQSLTLESKYNKNFDNNITLNLKLGLMQFDQEWLAEISPSGILALPGEDVFREGLTEELIYGERHIYSGIEILWGGWENHNWLLGVQLEDIRFHDLSWAVNGEDEALFQGIDGREHASVFAQDEYVITDSLTLTAGVRYDYYSDTIDNLAPRIAAVYRLKDRHILKAQYAGAFRPPTFSELYNVSKQFEGSTDLDPETIDTYEVGYIYKGVSTNGRITLFYSELENLITLNSSEELETPQYDNIAAAELMGSELEMDYQLTPSLKLDGNISYVTTEVGGDGEEIPGVANFMGNLGVFYSVTDNIEFNMQYQYVGKRNRNSQDTRGKCEAYQTVNFTANFYNLLQEGTTVRFGIDNLFDEEVTYPAPIFYGEDYIRSGIMLWAQISQTF